MERRDASPNQHGDQQWGNDPEMVDAVSAVPGDERLADDHQQHEQRHVQHIHLRAAATGSQLDVGGNCAERQQGDDQPRVLATERGQHDGLVHQSPGERKAADLGPQGGGGGEKVKQCHQRQQRGAELVENQHRAARQTGQRVPTIIGLFGPERGEVEPGAERADEGDSGEDQAPVPGLVGIANAADPGGPQQRHQDRNFQPGKVQFSHSSSSNNSGTAGASAGSRLRSAQ